MDYEHNLPTLYSQVIGGDEVYSNAAASGPQVGQIIAGRYNLVSQIGRGGMGEVWKATARNRPNPVAIKFLQREIWNPTDLEQVRQRFNLVVNLSHTNICTVNDLDIDPVAGVFLVMRFINGITLAQHCERKKAQISRFTIDEVCQLLQPVAAALDYAHSLGVVHRDVKLENIMLASQGNQAMIVDFELAEQIRTTITRQVTDFQPVGTLAYLSPEAWHGKNTNPESDQYALGLIAYEMLNGDLPFGRNAKPDVLRQCALHEAVPCVLTIGRANKVLRKVLAKDPTQRFTSCEEFVGALRNSLNSKMPKAKNKAKHREIANYRLHPPMLACMSIMLLAAFVTAGFESSVFWRAGSARNVQVETIQVDSSKSHELSEAPERDTVDDSKLRLGCKQIQDGKFDQAVTTLTQVLVADQQHFHALFFRGLAHRKQMHFHSALDDFDRAISINPSNAAAQFHRAETLRWMGGALRGNQICNPQTTSYVQRLNSRTN